MANPKSVKSPTPEPNSSSNGKLVDELGALEKEMAPHAQKLARIELLRKTLRAACPVSPDKPWTIEGARFMAIVGAKAPERSINYVALVKQIGAGVFAKFATCTLKDLELKVAPAIVAAVITSANTGSRSLKTFEKGAA